MRTILYVAFACVALVVGTAWAYAQYAASDDGLNGRDPALACCTQPKPQATTSCCGQGQDCCFPGSPCCGESCCGQGQDCCFAGSPCCGDSDCCTQGLACCNPASACCLAPASLKGGCCK